VTHRRNVSEAFGWSDVSDGEIAIFKPSASKSEAKGGKGYELVYRLKLQDVSDYNKNKTDKPAHQPQA